MAVSGAPCCVQGHVCENHPELPWGGLCCVVGAEGGMTCEHGSCGCGAGMPCPRCCPAPPQDGSMPITAAFVPARHAGGVA